MVTREVFSFFCFFESWYVEVTRDGKIAGIPFRIRSLSALVFLFFPIGVLRDRPCLDDIREVTRRRELADSSQASWREGPFRFVELFLVTSFLL
jgi:hypothetical protein